MQKHGVRRLEAGGRFVWNGIAGCGRARMFLALRAAPLGRHAQFAFASDFSRQGECGNVADTGLVAALPLLLRVDPKQNP